MGSRPTVQSPTTPTPTLALSPASTVDAVDRETLQHDISNISRRATTRRLQNVHIHCHNGWDIDANHSPLVSTPESFRNWDSFVQPSDNRQQATRSGQVRPQAREVQTMDETQAKGGVESTVQVDQGVSYSRGSDAYQTPSMIARSPDISWEERMLYQQTLLVTQVSLKLLDRSTPT